MRGRRAWVIRLRTIAPLAVIQVVPAPQLALAVKERRPRQAQGGDAGEQGSEQASNRQYPRAGRVDASRWDQPGDERPTRAMAAEDKQGQTHGKQHPQCVRLDASRE